MALHKYFEVKVCLCTVQYLIQLTAHVTITICYFVMRILHVSAHIDHLQGGNLQRNTLYGIWKRLMLSLNLSVTYCQQLSR
jgi:predicted ABC-type sugar transport system permease subunit